MFVFKLLSRPWTFSAIGNGGTSIPGAGRGGGQGRTWGGLGKVGASREAPAPTLGCGWSTFRDESAFPRQPRCGAVPVPSPFARQNS